MRTFSSVQALAALAIFTSTIFPAPASAIDMDPEEPDQVRSAAKTVAEVLVSMYADTKQNKILSGIPGLLKYPPYYWWEAGAMFGQLIDYWYYTGDSQWNDMIRTGILHQIGEDKNFMPANQSKDEGNDDQLFWAFTVMSAAEYNFPNPPDDQPGWLALAQSIFNQLVSRWDPSNCGGGVRWQIYQWLPGWNYKNLASNGGMFQLAARLALYTRNDTYARKAEEVFEWLENTSPLMTKELKVFDGTDVLQKCSKADETQWTYNYGIMIGGAAYMYNYTNGSQIWADRLNGFINHTSNFFWRDYKDVMMDACEVKQKCNIDQVSFKAYLARWFAVAVQLAPFTAPQIMPHLRKSGKAAAQTCVGTAPNSNGQPFACGNRWYWDGFDGNTGVGQQLAALSMINSNLITVSAPPMDNTTGGTSVGDPAAGTGGNDELPTYEHHMEITRHGRAGAIILTVVAVLSTVGGGYYLIL